MNSKAKFVRNFDVTSQFRKDWERLSHSGRYKMQELKKAMLLLIANDGPLPPEYKDHPLHGEFANQRDCHLGGDWLLLYTIRDEGTKKKRPLCSLEPGPTRSCSVDDYHRINPTVSAGDFSGDF